MHDENDSYTIDLKKNGRKKQVSIEKLENKLVCVYQQLFCNIGTIDCKTLLLYGFLPFHVVIFDSNAIGVAD